MASVLQPASTNRLKYTCTEYIKHAPHLVVLFTYKPIFLFIFFSFFFFLYFFSYLLFVCFVRSYFKHRHIVCPTASGPYIASANRMLMVMHTQNSIYLLVCFLFGYAHKSGMKSIFEKCRNLFHRLSVSVWFLASSSLRIPYFFLRFSLSFPSSREWYSAKCNSKT